VGTAGNPGTLVAIQRDRPCHAASIPTPLAKEIDFNNFASDYRPQA
jgi:hypothetical protein